MAGAIDLPPAIYDHPFPGHVTRYEYLASEVSARCSDLGGFKHEAEACSLAISERDCIIILPWWGVGGVGPIAYRSLLRHETGHCNGWRHK